MPYKTKASLEENSSFETDQHPKTRRCLTTKKLKGTSFFNDHLLKWYGLVKIGLGK